MTYVASHILSLTLLLVIFYVTGDLVARQTRALDDVGQRTGLMRMSIGIAVWMYLLMALACVGLYRRGVLIGAAVFIGTIGVGLNVAHRFSSAEALAKAVSPKTPGGRHMGRPLQNWIHILGWLPPAVVLAQLFVRTLGPWLGWDDMSAHLTLPRIWLAHGGFVHLPFNVYSHWPSNVQMLYGLGLAVEDYVLAKLLHLMFLGLLTVAVYRFASRAAPWAGLVAASLLLANDVVLVEAPVANIDIGVAFFFFMAVALAVEFRETGTRRALVLSGIFCGCVAGSKITGLGAIACVYPLIALGSTRRQIVRNSALFAACAFALALPWLLKSYVETGDPLYPVLWKYVAGIEWSDTIADQFWRWQNSIGMGRTPRDYALLPIRVILNGGGGYQNFAAWISKTWIVFLPLTLMFTPWVPVARRCLLPAGIYFVIWANSSQQSRFLISVLPLLAVSTAVTAVWAVDLLSRQVRSQKSEGQGFGYALVGLAIVGPPSCSAGRADTSVRGRSKPRAISSSIRRTFASGRPTRVCLRSEAAAASRRLLMLNSNHGFFLDRDYIADSFFEASQLNAAISAAGDRERADTAVRTARRTQHFRGSHAVGEGFPRCSGSICRDSTNATVLYRSRLTARLPFTS
jgi:hypothetical protein